jgi:hypothetical protein
MLFHTYRRTRKSFGRKLARRAVRKATGRVRRGLRTWNRSIHRRSYRQRPS